METVGEIAAAINLIDVKKENLRRSFLDLQSQSQSSFNLTLNWADLNSYFTTLRSSLQCEFHHLQTLHPYSDTTRVIARPELKSFCQNSDGLGLRRFISLTPDRRSLLAELPDAYRCAPDAAAMVLDAMTEFYTAYVPGPKSKELRLRKSGCLIMLEGLMRLKPHVTVELMEKAMLVAAECNVNRVPMTIPFTAREENVLGFLLLVVAYGLIDRFSMDELIDCFVTVAKRQHIVDLCRQMIPANKINDLIEKLISKNMLVAAVKYSIELEKTKEFSPVGLLEECKLKCMKKNDYPCNKAVKSEVKTLKWIMRCIDEYQVESPEFLKNLVLALIEELNKRIVKTPENVVAIVKQEEEEEEKQLPKKQKL